MFNIPPDQSALEYLQKTSRNFLDRETTGGFILMAVTVLTLVIANSSLADAYHHYLTEHLVIRFGEHFRFDLMIEGWINDGLMVIFFLVAGLELKREIIAGELSSTQKASMPLFAALGGMLVPALIFVVFNYNEPTLKGWGIPMATDIAYSLGIIALLGRRIPPQLKTFLIALAIADDLGAILIIAIFYSTEIDWTYLLIAGGIFLGLLTLNYSGLKRLYWYVFGGIGLWYCMLHSGIHPTIAGVLLAITIPSKAELDSKVLKERTDRYLAELGETDLGSKDPLEDKKQRRLLRRIKRDTERSRPPLLRLENRLVGFNAFFVIPIFALANAGVKLDIGLGSILSSDLGLGIFLGLAAGKAIGIALFAYVSYRLGLSSLPLFVSWRHILGIGFIAGIGFTMSLFITALAFNSPEMIKYSKISILLASLVSALIGVSILLWKRQSDN